MKYSTQIKQYKKANILKTYFLICGKHIEILESIYSIKKPNVDLYFFPFTSFGNPKLITDVVLWFTLVTAS